MTGPSMCAAEAWRTYTHPAEVALRLRLELDVLRAEHEDAYWSPEVVDAVHRIASQSAYVQLGERRGEPDRAQRARSHERRLVRLLHREHRTPGGAS